MKKNVIVFGTGFLGSAVQTVLRNNNYNVLGTYNTTASSNCEKIDICKKNEIENIIKKFHPDILINCTANTDIDFLEQHPETAHEINVIGTKNLAKCASQNNLRLIHISTDSVFDGEHGNYDELDPPNPLNVYAKSKLDGETMISKNCTNYVIIRTNIYGIGNKKFLFQWIVDNLQSNKPITGFDDIVFTPIEVTNLAEIIIEFIENEFVGLIHISSHTKLSKYNFAMLVAKKLNLNTSLISKGSSDDVKFYAKRPKNTSLSSIYFRNIVKTDVLELEDYLETLIKHNVINDDK